MTKRIFIVNDAEKNHNVKLALRVRICVFAFAVAASLALMGSSAFAAPLTVANHSFEDPAAPESVNIIGQLNGAAPGWTGFGFNARFAPSHPDATLYNPMGVLSIPGQGEIIGGTQGGLTNAPAGAGLYQTLADTYVEGYTYTFTLWVGGSYESPGGTQTIGFTTTATDLSGSLLASNTVDFPSAGNNWIQNSVFYTATAADHGQNIRIILGTTTANGTQTFDLAEVSYVIPEPASAVLLLGGLGVLGLVRRKSNR